MLLIKKNRLLMLRFIYGQFIDAPFINAQNVDAPVIKEKTVDVLAKFEQTVVSTVNLKKDH